MADVAAANVIGPCHVLRVGHQQRIEPGLCEFGADTPQLVGALFAGKLDVVKHDLPGRGRGAVAPQRVERIAFNCNQRRARRLARLLKLFGMVGGVQPRIIAKLGAGLEIAVEPLLGRIFDQVLDVEHLGVGLRA